MMARNKLTCFLASRFLSLHRCFF